MVKASTKHKFKQTEIGLIPEDWEVMQLNDITIKIGSGITPTGGTKVYTDSGRHFIRSQNIGWGNLILEDVVYISDEIHNTFENTEIELNDVFLNISGASIGRSAVSNQTLIGGNVNQHVCIIRTKNQIINPYFLNSFLLSNNGQKQIDSYQSGGNRQGLNIGQIKNFQIPIPPLPEQQAIATVLSDTDNLISSMQQLIQKKQAIKQGTMQQLLKPKKGWEVKKLGEVCEMQSGGTPLTSNKKYYNGDIPWVVITDITKAGKYIEITEKTISKEGVLNSSAKIFNKGTLLFAMYASIGKTAIALVETSCNQAILGIKPISIEVEYLYYILSFNENKYSQMGQTGTQSNLSKNIVQGIEIAIPTISEQTRIATILSDMDAEIESLQQQLQKYQALKQGLMQQLLSGKIRLV